MIQGYMDYLDQDLAKYGPEAKSCPLPVFIQLQAKSGFTLFNS